MESLSERNQEIQMTKEKKKQKIKMLIIVAACILAAAALFIYIVDSVINKHYNGYSILNTVKREDSNSVHYEAFHENLLKYSRDGASELRADGNTVWNGSYEMNNPRAAACGNYVIIADIGGKEAYVYNGADSGTQISEVHPIVQAKVAKQGVSAILVEDGNSNEIHIYNPYDKANSLLFNIPSDTGEDGYPVDMAISPDGKKFVTSFIGVANGVTQNKVTFYNLGDVGKNKANFIVGALDMGQEICPKVEFINDDTVCVYGEQSFHIYSMQELPEEIYKESFKQEIKSVMSNSRYLGFVLTDYTKTSKHEMRIYDLSGKKILKKNLDFEYDTVYFSDHEAVFYSNLAIHIIRFNGSEKFSYSLDRDLQYLFPTEKKDQYIWIDTNNIHLIKLTGVENSESK